MKPKNWNPYFTFLAILKYLYDNLFNNTPDKDAIMVAKHKSGYSYIPVRQGQNGDAPWIKYLFLIIVLLLLGIGLSFGQGCSDAGFCSMGAMKPDQPFHKQKRMKLRAVEIGHYIGRTKFKSIIQATTLDLNVGIGKKNTFQFKVPYMQIKGDGWRDKGIGDISISFTHNLLSTEKYKLNVTLGGKIPTHDGSKAKAANRTLPMYYQTSLGTYDLVLGASLLMRNWLIAAGYQKPFNSNKNDFNHLLWADHPRAKDAAKYPESRFLQRRSDVMLRVERNFRFSRFSFNAGLLAIHRFRKDIITSSETNEEIEAEGSDGLALTMLLGCAYRFSTKSSIKLGFGDRWYQRGHNPDGLSREQVFTGGYVLFF